MNNKELIERLYKIGRLPIDEGCYGMELAIISLVESYVNHQEYTDERYKQLLDSAENGEVKNTLKIRFGNYLNNKNRTKNKRK